MSEEKLPGATYILRTYSDSSHEETARLLLQDELLHPIESDLFPPEVAHPPMRDVLDVACGSGEWVLRIARTYPQANVIGVDIDDDRLQAARQKAQNAGEEGRPYPPNAQFLNMDVLKPFVFPEASFDYVNARFLATFVPREQWEDIVRECHRVLRPSGLIRLTETDLAYATSPAYETFSARLSTALKNADMSFSPTGANIGVVAVQKHLLRKVGFAPLRQHSSVMNFSAGEGLVHERAYQDILAAFKLVQGFIVSTGSSTSDEIEALYQRVLVEMQEPDFCGVGFFLTTWGAKIA